MKEGLFSVLNFTSQVPAQSLTLPQSLTFASKTGRRLRVGTLIDANYMDAKAIIQRRMSDWGRVRHNPKNFVPVKPLEVY